MTRGLSKDARRRGEERERESRQDREALTEKERKRVRGRGGERRSIRDIRKPIQPKRLVVQMTTPPPIHL